MWPIVVLAAILTVEASSIHSSIRSPIKLWEKTSDEMEDASFSSMLHFSTLLRH